jgi:hypothetical protein
MIIIQFLLHAVRSVFDKSAGSGTSFAMDQMETKPTRRPRFRRAPEPPPFRLTDDDVTIVRHLARHRFLRSTQIAALVNRSPDRTNDRLCRLFHAGYVDRPRAQLDYYPTSGSAPMVYALGDLGARLLAERDGANMPNECGRKTLKVGRPFIEHQLEIVEFNLSLERAARDRSDIRLFRADELIAAFPQRARERRNPVALRVTLSDNGSALEIGVIPDLIFGLGFPDGSRRCFMVEIDRGTMPVSRADLRQTSIERKLRGYLSADAAKEHERRFGWKAFRVLTVTADHHRARSIMEMVRQLHVAGSPGSRLFFFATRDELRASSPLGHAWLDGLGRRVKLT